MANTIQSETNELLASRTDSKSLRVIRSEIPSCVIYQKMRPASRRGDQVSMMYASQQNNFLTLEFGMDQETNLIYLVIPSPRQPGRVESPDR